VQITDTSAWSVLAYTVADDRGTGDPLDAALKSELRAICEAADFGAVSAAVQVDFRFTRGVYRAALKPAPCSREFEDISPTAQPLWRQIEAQLADTSELRVQRERVDLNAASGAVLREFLQFGRTECPADRHVVFMYGHASGPIGLFYDRASARRVPNTMSLNQLADAMRLLDGRASIVVFRDCFMNTLETACELRGHADYLIASQSEIPIAGVWPWMGLLAVLLPGAAPDAIALRMAMQIGKFLDDPAHRTPFADVPISLIDVNAVADVIKPLARLTDALHSARRDPVRRRRCARAVDRARIGHPDTPDDPGDPALLDVLRLCEELQQLTDEAVCGPAAELAEIVSRQVVVWHHAQRDRYRGISLFCKPANREDVERSYLISGDEHEAERDSDAYARLALCEATGWARIALNPLSVE
jgi:hypothetical protein